MQQPLSERELSGIRDFCRAWQVAEFSLFGSVLRSDYGPQSDVDVLVEFQSGVEWGIDEWITMRDELERLFGRRVDLVSRRSLRNPFRRHEILKTRRVVYPAAA